MKLSIFGSTGFIEIIFKTLSNHIPIKNILLPKTNDILYLISTVDNYNILMI